MNIGDRIKIRTLSEISQILKRNITSRNDDLDFSRDMKFFCGSTDHLVERHLMTVRGEPVWRLKNGWWWKESWLSADFFSDEDFDI